MDLISKYNKGDKDYYERKIRLLLQTGKEKAALLPAYIAISEYKSEELKELAESEAYQKFEKQVQQPFTVPKGFKTTYQSALSRLLDVAGFAFDEEENIIVYKGDVLWDSDLYAVEDISEYFGVEASDIVILGDLYVMGRIHLHHISLYVQGNIFASDIYMGDATLECTGNVFADEEIVMSEDIGGTSAYIYGNVKTPVFVAAPEELQIYGTVHPETVCIGLKNYEFDGIKISKFHSGEELSRNIDTNSAYDQDFHYRLQTGTLFKK